MQKSTLYNINLYATTDTCIEVFKQDNIRIKSEKGLQILPCIIKETEVMYYVKHLTS